MAAFRTMNLESELKIHTLICDDDPSFRNGLNLWLKGRAQSSLCKSTEELWALLRQRHYDLIFLDLHLEYELEGLEALKRIREEYPEARVIIISGNRDIEAVKECMRVGAFDYICKGDHLSSITMTLDRIFQLHFLSKKLNQASVKQSAPDSLCLIGASKETVKLRELIEKFRKSDASVLISGETGSGKEIIAQSLRKVTKNGLPEPFVAVDASTFNSGNVESILFGYEKGAFTGADRSKPGLFEEASGGMIYFDEIGNMPLEIQKKLLRVLQEKQLRRVGGDRMYSLEFRVIAATNLDLEKACEQGRFLPDLWQRLKTLPIHSPSLRERGEDIPELSDFYLNKRKVKNKSTPLHLSESVLAAFRNYEWPGNIRELFSVLEFCCVMADGDRIEFEHLPEKIRHTLGGEGFDRGWSDLPLFQGAKKAEKTKDDAREATGTAPGVLSSLVREDESFFESTAGFQKLLIQKVVQDVGGNISKAALKLKMDRSHLYTKMKEFGLKS